MDLYSERAKKASDQNYYDFTNLRGLVTLIDNRSVEDYLKWP